MTFTPQDVTGSTPVSEPPFSVREPFLIGRTDITTITMVRHGQQQYPVGTVFEHAKWADPPLSEIGRAQARAVGRSLSVRQVDHVVCSPLQRARDTALAIAEHHGLSPTIVPDIREIESYRDLPADQRPQEMVDPDEWRARQQAFRLDRRWDHLPYSESSSEFRERCLRALDAIISAHAGQHLVIVSHGGVINAYLAAVLGLDEDLFFLPNHASISEVVLDDEIRVMRSINEHGYLPVEIRTY